MKRLRRASALDTLRFGTTVLLPTLAQGIILRRPRVVALAGKMDADRRAARLLRRLRDKYDSGALVMSIPLRPVVVLLGPDDIRRVLADSPEPFALDVREKRAALSHFQPHGVLISHGSVRAERRSFNQEVLDTHRPVHRLSDDLLTKLTEEIRPLVTRPRNEQLTWEEFSSAWWRAVRRIVLGDAARDDTELTDLLNRLRGDANWAYARPKRKASFDRFARRLRGHLDRAEPGSLAGLISAVPASGRTDPYGQVPHWLFASDAAGIAAYRTLALLGSHPAQEARAAGDKGELSFLRACVKECVRLWPTTLAILRDGTRGTTWGEDVLPRQRPLMVHSAFANRDPEVLDRPDQFTPDIWLDGTADRLWSIAPFSRGPGECPGQNLVLFLTSHLLAILLEHHRFEPSRRLDRGRALPYTMDHFTLRFDMVPR